MTDEPLAYLNGKMIPASQAALPVSDAGVVLGATVTEMTRTFSHEPFRLEDHLDRLFRSLQYARLDIGMERSELARISRELVAHHARLIDKDDDLGLIQFVTAGPYATYAGVAGRPPPSGPTVCVHTFALPFDLWAPRLETGLYLVIPSVRQVPPQCYHPHVKHRSRMHYYLAEKEAQAVDPAASALLLDLEGYVTETSSANFLMVRDGAIISPTTRNILPGISRQVVIELAEQLGIAFVERDIPVSELSRTEEALTTSTPYCLMPVTRINGSRVGGGKPGPVFYRLAEAWSEMVGRNILQQIQQGARRQRQALAARGG